MNAWFRGSLVLVSSLMASCALESGGSEPSPDEAETAAVPVVTRSNSPTAPEALAPEPSEPAAPEPAAAEEPSEMPAGVFESIDALCRAQKVLVAPSLRRAQQSHQDFNPDFKLVPSCALAPHGFEQVNVKLGGPFLEVAAITANLRSGNGLFVVVRTAEGWRALPRASSLSAHSDPGCFSIERDAGLRRIEVMGPDTAPALVVLESTSRGDHIEHGDSENPANMRFWDDRKIYASACRVGAAGMVCDDRVVIRKELSAGSVESSPESILRFSTSYRVDDTGTLRTEATYVPDANGH